MYDYLTNIHFILTSFGLNNLEQKKLDESLNCGQQNMNLWWISNHVNNLSAKHNRICCLQFLSDVLYFSAPCLCNCSDVRARQMNCFGCYLQICWYQCPCWSIIAVQTWQRYTRGSLETVTHFHSLILSIGLILLSVLK